MSDAEEVYTLDRAKEDIETLKDSNKEIKKKLKDCKKTVANLEETVDTLGTVQEENKQIKKKIKSVEKDIDQLKKEMHRFLPKKIPVSYVFCGKSFNKVHFRLQLIPNLCKLLKLMNGNSS
jgi:DNA repair exonuclease SbcCD ATPase subunit